MPTTPVRVGVLASGSGSNLQALLDACNAGTIPIQIAVVVCNVADAYAVERATRADLPVYTLPHRTFASREAFEDAIQHHLAQHEVELVVLAGFMRILTSSFVRRWSRRLINIHPSLLPAFPGTHAVRQALEYGVKWSGCTVHLVDEGVDTGSILEQAVVPVLADDDEKSLHARIQVEEHRIFPEVVGRIARELRAATPR